MKRIIFVTTLPLWSLGKGQGGPALTQTLTRYISEGWDVYLVTDEPANIDYPALDKEHIICLNPSIFKKYGHMRKIGLLFRWLDHKVMNCHFSSVIEKLVKEGTAETLIYAYEIFGVDACKRISKQYKVPLVTRFQGTILGQYANTRANRIKRYPHFQALSTEADLVIMTDDGTQGDRVLAELKNTSDNLFLRNGLELMDENIEEMYHSFDRESFRESLGITQDETMLLTVSRLVPWKKVERAIKGVAECKEEKVRLVIVGDGESRKELQETAEQLGVLERIVFAGAVPHAEVYKYMMACDVFVSLYDLSNVGNPLLEAMTLGKCIVTLDVGDTYKLINNRENGVLLTYDTLHTLGSVFSELHQNHELRRVLGEKATVYAQEHFYSWEKRMSIESEKVNALLKK